MSRILPLVVALGLAAGAATADRALVIGASEEARRGLFRGGDEVDTAQALRDAGFEVITADASSVTAMRAALSAFLDGIAAHERVVVQLSGRFVNGAGRTWLLESGSAARPDLATVDDTGLSIDTVLAIAGRVPGASVVALGQGEPPATPGAGLATGAALGAIPQGVSVVQGDADSVARFVAGPLLEEGRSVQASIAAARGVSGLGFLAPRVAFLPEGEERAPAAPDAAEVERAIWQATLAQDTVAAYEGYLERYPQGFFGDQARAAIERIRTEPNRLARLAEEDLDLDRATRRKIQQELTLLGYEPRGVDGVFGPGSRAAISRFQVKNGFPDTGYVDATQIERLALQAERFRAEQAAEETRQRLEREKQDREAWAALGANPDEADLRTYLERYPQGLFAPIARERLAAFEAETEAQAAAQDKTDWERAAATGTVLAYNAYLEAHPKGAYVAEAKDRIAALAGADSEAQKAARAEEAALGLNPVTRLLVEQRLEQLRLSPGMVDGTFDDATRAALRQYQRDRGLPVTGYMSQAVATQMLADLGGILAPGR